MAFCSKCGSSVGEGLAFCPQCGAALDAAAVPPPFSAPPPVGSAPPYALAAPASGLQENVAACLSYALGWLTGIVFLLIDKRPFVRFHAAQSIVVFGALHIIRLVIAFVFLGASGLGFFSIWSLLSMLVSLVTLVAWIVLMVTAYQGKRLEVPVAAGVAKGIAGNPSI